ncbi:type IV toxin-antitoxin system AbiEi family antitoxin domain-containing protein, partial [Stenotrophomonas maltophilia]|uniref:type IV toxin-antitoxin system AbiEi family antitoxin domain-containing protein n=1 Tax=Stenotrophomonas maltophilia TaxID=40324 RepID=UPI003D18E5AB
MRVPKGVICLVSALHYHEMTLQNPHSVWVAIGEHAHKPKVPHLAVRFLHFGDAALSTGVETVVIDSVKVRI